MSDEPMHCARARDLVALVPGSELPLDVDRPVRTHLADCATCRRELGAYLSARRALRSISPEALPGHERFFRQLRTDTLDAVRVGTTQRRRGLLSVPGLLTAAALFLTGVYCFSSFLPSPKPWRDMPVLDGHESTKADSPVRIREVGYYGYGLLGRHLLNTRELSQVVPGSELLPSGKPAPSARPEETAESEESATGK